MNRIVILGTGGHAKVLAEALRAMEKTDIHFAGPEDEATLLATDPGTVLLVNGVGSIGDSSKRRVLHERFRNAGFRFFTVIHPSAIVAADAEISEGAQVMAGAILQPGVHVGANAIINTGAIVDHDGIISAHAHVATGARLAGAVTVGTGAHIGAGAIVIQGIDIGANAIVGAGAVVVGSVSTGTVVVGVPAKQKS